MMIAENTTHFVTPKGMQDYGKMFKQRWFDIISEPSAEKKEEPEDNRPSEEIAADIWSRIKGY